MKVKIRKGDTVEVISGKLEEKGKRGQVIKVLPAESRVVVQGINLHVKNKKAMQVQGGQANPGQIHFEAPFDISNVMLVCPKCGEPARVGVQRDEDGTHRVCKKCQALID